MFPKQVLRAIVIAVVSAQEQRPERSYTLVADAGSTGTRLYMYNALKGEAKEPEHAFDITVLGKGPALSSFQDKPGEADAAVQKQLEDAKKAIPEGYHGTVPLMIFATAGMRLVETSKANAVYEGLRKGLLSKNYKFDQSALLAKTISGREEGVYAFLAANYLSKRIGVDLQIRENDLMGVLDLGGSSTQIAIPPLMQDNRRLLHSLSEESMYVKSFLSLGMERMRLLTYKGILEDANRVAHEVHKVPNPCAFNGFSEAGERWFGTGDMDQCQHIIANILKKETHACRADKASKSSCLPLRLPEHVRRRLSEGLQHFFLISGYVFVVDFANWWIKQQGAVLKGTNDSAHDRLLLAMTESETFVRPTIRELRAAAAIVCAGPWVNISAAAFSTSTAHKRTPPHKVAHRCFEINYIVSLLSIGYGFPEDVRALHFVDTIAGQEVEWTLGAYLFSRAAQGLSISLAESGADDFLGRSDRSLGSASDGSVGNLAVAAGALLFGISIVILLKRACTQAASKNA